YIHKLLNYVITDKDKINQLQDLDCHAVNEFNHNIKKMEREFNKIKLAAKYETINGYIIDITENRITVYIPENKIIHQIKLFDNRLIHLFDIKYPSENTIEIINKETNKSIILTKYTQVTLKIVSRLQHDEIHKKIDIYIQDIQNLTEYTENQYSQYLSSE
ncbi:MAG: hypothetical protein MUO21_08235, partial [Nitrososphaeraceae archaeon]|nr:hypothetical protein [Nitrososphaeraceae archaeon]